MSCRDWVIQDLQRRLKCKEQEYLQQVEKQSDFSATIMQQREVPHSRKWSLRS